MVIKSLGWGSKFDNKISKTSLQDTVVIKINYMNVVKISIDSSGGNFLFCYNV